MRQIFQVVFCICSVLCAAAAFFLGVFLGFFYALIGAGAALIFLLLTLLMKHGNPFRREEEEPHPDFMNTDEENERIRAAAQNELGQTAADAQAEVQTAAAEPDLIEGNDEKK